MNKDCVRNNGAALGENAKSMSWGLANVPTRIPDELITDPSELASPLSGAVCMSLFHQ